MRVIVKFSIISIKKFMKTGSPCMDVWRVQIWVAKFDF